MTQDAQLDPETVLAEFKKNGVTHVVYLPDSETNHLFIAMEEDPDIDVIPVAREGETMAIAAGLTIGGKKPICLIQNTGMMESGDSIRGMGLDINLPLVMMIGYRGWTRHGVTPDSAARFTEPILDAWGIKYYLVESGNDADRITTAFEEAEATSRPVAVLIGDEYHGFNRMNLDQEREQVLQQRGS
jgi:sulfopyruvate decarboxylase TPP-binding subunit